MATKTSIDKTRLLPAWRRYVGTFYAATGGQLADAVSAGLHMLILSGGYGCVLATEPIGT